MKKSVLLLCMSMGLSQVAMSKVVQVCPSLSSEASRIVSDIESLSGSLKSGEKCRSIGERLSLINEVVGSEEWDNFKSILSGTDVVSLESEQVDRLSLLTSEVSSSLSQTVALLNGAGSDCIEDEQKAGFLSVLSGVTKEVSTIAGAATGPYGMAITLGGNLLSDAISGIDTYFKSGKIYDFENGEEELLFMNQFCSFVEVKKDVADFTGMDSRVEELEELDSYLDIKLDDLRANCEECDAYVVVHEVKKEADKAIAKIIADINIRANTTEKSETFSHCAEIARAIHSPESDLDALMNIYSNYENPLMSVNDTALIENVLEARGVLKEEFPSLSDCWSMTDEKMVSESRRFNLIIRDDIVRLNDKIFSQQLAGLRVAANKRYENELGEFTAKSVERIEWTKREKEKVAESLNDPSREIALAKIRKDHKALEDRITGSLLPSYLKFLVNRNKETIEDFNKDFKSFRKRTLKSYRSSLGEEITINSLSDLAEELKVTKKKGVEPRIFLSDYRRTLEEYNIALSQRETIKRYCEYLAYTSTINSRTNYTCTRRLEKVNSEFRKAERYKTEIEALVNFDKWADSNLNLQSTRVRDYSALIKDWNSRGEARWKKK